MHDDCPLCRAEREVVLWRDEYCRVIQIGEPDYPGFCRVVWNAHVREMSDLGRAERDGLMAVVHATELVLRDALRPDKINLASLGNQVAHLHWHVIPRFVDDAHFPDAVWGARRRAGAPRSIEAATLAAGLKQCLGR